MTASVRAARRSAILVIGETSEKGLRGHDDGSSSSCGPRDFLIAGHDRQSLGGGGALDQTNDQVICFDTRTCESHVNAGGLDPMWLVDPVADENGRVASIPTACDQLSEFRKIDARKFRRENSDDMENVVGIDEKGHGNRIRGDFWNDWIVLGTSRTIMPLALWTSCSLPRPQARLRTERDRSV